MSDEMNDNLQDVVQDVQNETEQVQEEIQEEQIQENDGAPQPSVEKKTYEHSFRELRTKKDEAEARALAAERRARAVEEQYYAAIKPQQAPVAEEPEPADGDYVEWGKVKNRIKKVEAKFDQLQTFAHQQMEEQKLRSKYPDIDSIVTDANLNRLAMNDPEAAQAINAAGSLYARGLLAYKLIKGSDNIPENQPELISEQKLKQHMYKARSLSQTQPQRGQTPLSRVNNVLGGGSISDDMAKALQKEVDDAVNNYRRE